MKKEELDIAEKAIITSQNIANANEDVIIDFVANNTEQAEKLSERLNNDERTQFMLGKLVDANRDKDVTKLIEKIKVIKHRRTMRMFVRVGLSTAAIFILAFFAWNYEQKSDKTIVEVNHTDIVPILITDEGSVINLDELTEVISENNYEIKKEDKNSISYSKNSDSVAETKYNEVKIPSKHMYKIKLEDGTQVTLNAGSSLRYPITFFGGERCVELKGEGYFSVAKSDKPFIVKINDMKIAVYGTQFNIKTLSSGTVETVLIGGSIGVKIKEKDEIVMQPNQLLTYDEQNSIIELSNTNVSKYIHWLDNNFNYVDVALKDILNDLSQWYGVDFKTNEDLKNIRLSLFSSRDCDLKEMIEFVESLTDVKFIKEGGQCYEIYR